jgi:hypothetical protein
VGETPSAVVAADLECAAVVPRDACHIPAVVPPDEGCLHNAGHGIALNRAIPLIF